MHASRCPSMHDSQCMPLHMSHAVQNGCQLCDHQHYHELCVAQPGGIRNSGAAADLWPHPRCSHGMAHLMQWQSLLCPLLYLCCVATCAVLTGCSQCHTASALLSNAGSELQQCKPDTIELVCLMHVCIAV